ncbi:MAG TPA: S8 family peptidase [Oscillatoriaceae cyanobacterium]
MPDLRKKSLSLGAIALTALLAACQQAGPTMPMFGAERTSQPIGAEAVPGRLLVTWRHPEQAQAILQKLGLAEHALDDSDVGVVDLANGVSAEALKTAAGAALESVQPDYLLHDYATPNDPMYARQYALKRLEAPAAWDITRGDPKVKIAIVDTGCDTGHPDLRDQIVGSFNSIGWRGALGVGSVRDDNGHGTHCAGIAAAEGNNDEGISGIAPGCKLLVVKALDTQGTGSASDIARGVNWAADHGASVISLSMGTTQDSSVMREAVAHALQKGVVVVAAMGNEGQTLRNYPAAYPGVIAVGATDQSDQVASFSTRGDWISVSAPGVSILSTTPTYPVTLTQEAHLAASYGTMSGTSMATPLVAGVAALVRSAHPNWTPAQVKQDLENTAVGSGFSSAEGHGRVDALAALR